MHVLKLASIIGNFHPGQATRQRTLSPQRRDRIIDRITELNLKDPDFEL